MGIRGPGRIAFLGPPRGSEIFGCHGTSYPVENVTLAAGATYTSGDLRDGTVVPSDAIGLWMMLYGYCDAVAKSLGIESADFTPDSYSSRVLSSIANVRFSTPAMVRLGTGANAGKVKIKAINGNWADITAWPVGGWR